jgi:hypothetical protein
MQQQKKRSKKKKQESKELPATYHKLDIKV